MEAIMGMISEEQAYKAMFRFLERYYEETQAADIGALLGSMNVQIFQDSRPADPAMWGEWQVAVKDVLSDPHGTTVAG
jgi:hypothetical protein